MIFCVENETALDLSGITGVPDPAVFCAKIGEELFSLLGITGHTEDVEVSLYVVEEETIREMNREHRGIDAATDVLSFPNLDASSGELPQQMIEQAGVDCRDPETGRILLGDIVISSARVLAQAEAYGHTPRREFAFLLTHSLLHLMGFDHETDMQAADMEEKQEAVLSRLGITRG